MADAAAGQCQDPSATGLLFPPSPLSLGLRYTATGVT